MKVRRGKISKEEVLKGSVAKKELRRINNKDETFINRAPAETKIFFLS